MTTLVVQLTLWIDLWAPPEMAGGLKNRQADMIHEALEEVVQQTNEAGELIIVCKQDLQKCFDSVRVDTAR